MGWYEEVKGDWAKACQFTESPKGWTNRLLGMEWLEKIFHPCTKPGDSRIYRLLILDGYDCHIRIEFAEFYQFHNIVLYCLPPHSSHVLQPLDVALFGPLQYAYGKLIDDYTRHGHVGFGKPTYPSCYAFAACSIVPLNSWDFLTKVETVRASTNLLPVTNVPSTPRNVAALCRRVRQVQLMLKSTNSSLMGTAELGEIIDQLPRFGLGADKDRALEAHTFTKWRKQHKKEVKSGRRKLGATN